MYINCDRKCIAVSEREREREREIVFLFYAQKCQAIPPFTELSIFVLKNEALTFQSPHLFILIEISVF